MTANAHPPMLHLEPAMVTCSVPPSSAGAGARSGAHAGPWKRHTCILMPRSLGGASPSSSPCWGLGHALLARASHGKSSIGAWSKLS
eukprot:13043100-Alexandrium_andersonii.AAC.1